MPTQWSEAEQVPLGCIAPYAVASGGQGRSPLRGHEGDFGQLLSLLMGQR